MIPEYYADGHVRERIVEFLGGPPLEEATAMSISAKGPGSADYPAEPQPVSELFGCLDRGLDIARSLWDREALLAHLDVDYVNFTFPAEPLLGPGRTFDVQRPVARAIQEVLLAAGIGPLHLLSGRGHHFVWKVLRCDPAFHRLATLAPVPESLRSRYSQPHPPGGDRVEPELGAAHAGLGLVMEHVAHAVMERSASLCQIPVELTAVDVGPAERGREVVSIDVSEYGDALTDRQIRVPFSVYLKPQQHRFTLGPSVNNLPPIFMVPLHEMEERHALLLMRDPREVQRLARSASVRIPDHSRGMSRLIDAYEGSRLRRFHLDFYSREHEPPALWPSTYDRLDLGSLPPCGATPLARPNPLLLKPARIRHVVRILMAHGWHPRHIAGLIRSKYERDHGWGARWYVEDATSRADFYVRLFAGLVVAGRDRLVDFNCLSTQEKGLDVEGCCPSDLIELRDVLLARYGP